MYDSNHSHSDFPRIPIFYSKFPGNIEKLDIEFWQKSNDTQKWAENKAAP